MNHMKEQVRERYARIAQEIRNETRASTRGCCTSCCTPGKGSSRMDLSGYYSGAEELELPEDTIKASLGCGNPVALANLSPGEIVLDLGSGGGIDVLLSAKRVSPRGKAYGLDMTDEMLELARLNQRHAGIANAEFLKGDIEDIPLPDNHVDVVISNCVINLSVDKDQALGEAYRVLKPGGRFAVMDVVFTQDKGSIPPELIDEMERRVGCIVGALEIGDYEERLSRAGFVDVSVRVIQEYPSGLPESSCCENPKASETAPPIASAFIEARKPSMV